MRNVRIQEGLLRLHKCCVSGIRSHTYTPTEGIVMEASEIRAGIKDLAARVDDIRDWL